VTAGPFRHEPSPGGAPAPSAAAEGRPAVFLDRDGVLAEPIVRADGHAYAPTQVEDFLIVPEAGAQVQRLRDAGFICIVFTNQPELANGLLVRTDLDTMHRQLAAVVPLDDIYVCPHDKSEGCPCHKPATAMLDEAAARWGIDLSRSYAIGDRWRDIGAGLAAGCYSILIDRPYSGDTYEPDARVATLTEAVDTVLRHAHERQTHAQGS
jgi:D-glycero-D-manno-heptose 1,7-bisphosphate phosphatase